MTRIVNCCYANLNCRGTIDEALGEDITNEIIIGILPVLLLTATSLNRKIIKLYTAEYSNRLTKLWVRHGTNVTQDNGAFALPSNYLYVNTSQASQPLSVVCGEGSAIIRVTVVNKL